MRSLPLCAALLTTLLLTGCRLHAPVAITPAAPLPETFTHAIETAPPPPTVAPWWLQFNDPGLTALEETLLAGNLEIRQAYARLSQFEAVSRVADSALLPSLNLAGAASRGRQETNGTDLTTSGQSLSLAASYEIDLWQKLRANRQAAQLDFSASREEIKTLYLILTSQAADLYFLAIEQRAQLALTDAIIDSLRTIRDQVEFRYRRGIAPSLDLYQADQNLAAAKARKPEQETALAITEHGLAVLLGHYPDHDPISGKGPLPATLPAAPPAPPAGIPAALLLQRPDVQGAFLRVQSSDAKTAAAVADRFPALNLSGALGVGRTDSGLSVVHATFWNLLIGLTQPIIDNGRRQAEADRRAAITAEALARYQQVVLQAFQEVENSLVANRAAEQQLALKDTELAAAAATLRRATDGYFQGLNNYLAVLVAQRQHHEVSRQQLSARRQLLSARITLWRALGGDWLETSLAANLSSQPNEDSHHEN